MANTTKAAEAAAKFIAEATEAGFTVKAHGGIVEVHKRFTPGDTAAFVAADGDGPALIAMVPTVAAGSVWGTDGGTVGGHAAIANGHYHLKVSGAAKRFVAAVVKAAA